MRDWLDDILDIKVLDGLTVGMAIKVIYDILLWVATISLAAWIVMRLKGII